MLRHAFFALLIVAVMGGGAAAAHQVPLALTIVTVDDAGMGRKMQITHRIPVHDCLTMLEKLKIKTPIEQLETQARLALYVESTFSLRDKAGAKILVETIGAEIDGEFFYIYQETKLNAPKAMEMRAETLAIAGPDWLHHVNIERGNEIASVDFFGKGRWRQFPF